MGTAFCTTLMAGVVLAQKRRRLFCLAGLLFVALAVMVGDYIWVYQPLVEMVTPPGQSRPAEFVTYHKASKWLNALAISLCGIAAMFLCGQKAND